jgi:hypothetical protein
MIVYRYEDKDGLGPYNAGEDDIFEYHNNSPKHPVPRVDKVKGTGEELELAGHEKFGKWAFVCGFASMAQLDDWFTKREQRILADAGYTLWAIEVDDADVIVGRRQVLIRKPVRGTRTRIDTVVAAARSRA